MPAEAFASVNECNFFGYSIGKEDGPVKSAIAPTTNNHPLSLIEIRVTNDVFDALIFEFRYVSVYYQNRTVCLGSSQDHIGYEILMTWSI
jgi:hypothetical protein